MKRVKTRRKNLRISNPIGFSLFIAGCLLALGIIAVVITLVVGYGEDAVRYVQEQIQGTVEVINDQPTFTPEPSETPEASETPIETPKVGTPAPTETPTPAPIGNLSDTPEPTPDVNAPLYAVTVGINPMRDAGNSGKEMIEECAFNLEFAQRLGKYLESQGATVIITRDSNEVAMSAKKRGMIIADAKCDIALEIVCNHTSSGGGCYVRYGNSKSYAAELAAAYQEATGIPFQSNHKSGLYQKTEDTIKYSKCPCVRLVLCNWSSSSQREIVEDETVQMKIFKAIASVMSAQVKKK